MFDRLLEALSFQLPPHGYCLLWDPWLVGAHVGADATIAFSYFAIPLTLIYIVLKRNDIKFGSIFWLFAIFIASCGFTHLMMIWNLWHGDYGLEAVVKIISALASFGTAVVIMRLAPAIIRIPSNQQLEKVNQQLRDKVAERDAALARARAADEEKDKAIATLIQAQKMEAVGQLTGGLSHDLNNLLMGISGNLELIHRNPRKSSKVLKWAGTGIDAVARAAHLIAQLLTFSREQKLQLKEVRLNALLDDVMDLIGRTIGPDIVLNFDPGEDVVVNVDKVQLELALLNLTINARDAMNERGTITISTSVSDGPNGGSVEIDVTDTGSGIPEDVVAHVFEPFFTTKDVGKGTGLGLSMVYGVATQCGGDVHIKQTSPKGTTVTICLPIVEQPELPDQPTAEETIPDTLTKNILVIDDEPLVRNTLEDILISLGHNVRLSEDGAEALVYLKTNKPDLILVDYSMPIMNGMEVFKAARLLHPRIPIVFVTGYAQNAELSEQVVLKKPLTIDDMQKTLAQVFS